MLTRVAELAREWASPVHVGQLDLRQAFDKIKHSAVIEALFEKQVPLQLIAVLVAWWSPERLRLNPSLGSLQSRWAQSDAGWSLDSPLGRLWVSCDDILVFARPELVLTQMIGECCAEFGEIGLEVALDKKTFWSSSVDCTWWSNVFLSRGLLRSNSLETSLTSVDTAVKVRNTVNTKRMEYSVVGPQSSRICRCPFFERVNAFRVSVASSALARLLCCVVCCRRRPDESPVDHWGLAEQFGLDLPQLCL